MSVPPYYKQEGNATCSLAVLRMVLKAKGISVTEKELLQQVEPDYGKNFKNLWNPTIAKLTVSHGIKVTMYADWPLFKTEQLLKAQNEYKKNSKSFNYKQYENPDDTDVLPEPLPLSYKEMFIAIENGCTVVYGHLS